MYMYGLHSADCNYSESSEINMSLCYNYLDRFIILCRHICICQCHVYFCVYCIILHPIASILYLIAYSIFCQRYTGLRFYLLNLIIYDRLLLYMITTG